MNSIGYLDSPLGLLKVSCTAKGINAITFIDWKDEPESDEKPKVLIACLNQLGEYFKGKRREFTIPVDLSGGTEFYREVWRLVQAIPYGRTRCYSKIAETLGRPNASRAVGLANGRNPIPILIPCHRVIGKNGSLTGYAYGLEMKEALLAIENPRRFAQQTALW